MPARRRWPPALAARLRGEGIEPVSVREPGRHRCRRGDPGSLPRPGQPVPPEHRVALHLRGSGPFGAGGHPAGTGGRTGGGLRPVRVVHASLSIGWTWPRSLGGDLVNRVATGGLQPHLTLVLDIPPDAGVARQRAGGKTRDRLEQEDAQFHRRVAEAYLAANGNGVRHLDGMAPPAAVLDAAWSELVAAAPATFRRGG